MPPRVIDDLAWGPRLQAALTIYAPEGADRRVLIDACATVEGSTPTTYYRLLKVPERPTDGPRQTMAWTLAVAMGYDPRDPLFELEDFTPPAAFADTKRLRKLLRSALTSSWGDIAADLDTQAA